MKKWIALFALLLPIIACNRQTILASADEFGLEFNYLGCDDWPSDRQPDTYITRSVDSGRVTYHVIDPAGCGYSVRNPGYELTDDSTLRLSYELFTDGDVAACLCEYKSEFRFRKDPRATHVTFEHTSN